MTQYKYHFLSDIQYIMNHVQIKKGLSLISPHSFYHRQKSVVSVDTGYPRCRANVDTSCYHFALREPNLPLDLSPFNQNSIITLQHKVSFSSYLCKKVVNVRGGWENKAVLYWGVSYKTALEINSKGNAWMIILFLNLEGTALHSTRRE